MKVHKLQVSNVQECNTITFGQIIRDYRTERDYTLQQVAKLSEVNVSTLCILENGGIKKPNVKHVLSLIHVLKMPFEQTISHYLEFIERPETLKTLLSEALRRHLPTLIKKVTLKLLECPRLDSLLAIEYIYKMVGTVKIPSIQLTLYNTIATYTRERGVTFYLAKTLFQKYLIERYDFSRLDETYRDGKELLYYIHNLSSSERVIVYYRLGLHAYSLKYYPQCIEFCKKGMEEDSTSSALKESAMLAVCNCYIFIGCYDIAEIYLEEYEKLSGKLVRHNTNYIRAQIKAKRGHHIQSIPQLLECFNSADRHSRLPIVNDLLDAYTYVEDYIGIQTLLDKEDSFLPLQLITPNCQDELGYYYKHKSVFQINRGFFTEGMKHLLDGLVCYGSIRNYTKTNECLQLLLHYHRIHEKGIDLHLIYKLEDIYNQLNNERRCHRA